MRKLRRPVSLVFALVVSLGLIGILIAVVLPQLTATVAEVAARLPEYISSAVNWLNDFLAGFGIEIESLKNFTVDWEKVFSELTTYLKEGSANVDGSSVVDTVTGVGTSVVSTVMNTFLGLVVAVYILAQKERIGRFTRRCIDAFLPQKAASGLARIASMASETFSNFVAGQLADSCILGILCYICMRIFRFPYPEVISVVIGVTSLVPMVGSFIGEVIGALLILIVSPLKALLFVVMVLAIQQVDGAFIYPRIVGRSVGRVLRGHRRRQRRGRHRRDDRRARVRAYLRPAARGRGRPAPPPGGKTGIRSDQNLCAGLQKYPKRPFLLKRRALYAIFLSIGG